MLHDTTPLKKTLLLISLGLLFSIILFPYAKNGFWADDALNSQTWGLINRFDTTVFDFSYRVSKTWLFEYGRILFPWPAIYGFFYLLRDELAVRLADMALLATHLGLTIWLLRKIGINWKTLGLFALSFMGLLQIRDYGDPIAAYAGFSQSVGILLTCSLLLLQKWHETKSVAWLISSSILAAFSMTCYEINAVYVPIALIIVVLPPTNRTLIRDVAIVTTPFIAFILLNLFLKQIAVTPYDGSKFGALSAVPVTFAKQLFATFPGSYYAFLGYQDFPISQILNAAIRSKLAWTIVILWSIIATLLLRQNAPPQPGVRAAVAGALLLLIIPPLLISVSIKYQALLVWGTGHVPVYYQCIGLAFIVAASIEKISTMAGARILTILTPFGGAFIALTWTVNMHHSSALDRTFREPRDSFVAALKRGLLDTVRDGDVLTIDPGQPVFINGNLIFQMTNKNISIPNELAIAGWFVSLPKEGAKHFNLSRDAASDNQWVVVEK